MHLLQRLAALAVVLLLTVFAITRGVLPAWHGVSSDFPNYYTAAQIVAHGGDVTRLYDDAWFQEQMRAYGNGRVGKFSPFPPPTALLLLPLVHLQPLDALRCMTVISLLCLVAAMVLLARILSWRLEAAAAFLLLSGYALVGSLRLGQPYILISMLCILGYYLRLRGRPVASGICFGLFAPIKYVPLIFLGYFAVRGERRLATSGALTIVAVCAVSVAVLGWDVHEKFLSTVFGAHLSGHLSLQSPFTVSFQSIDSLCYRLFVYDAVENPHPFLSQPQLRWPCVLLVKLALGSIALLSLRRLTRLSPGTAAAPSIGILGLLTLLIAPASATYHFVLLWLPLALLVDYFLRCGARPVAALLVCGFALIGFFPYGLTNGFAGRGLLSVLAYPRLLLLTAMLLVSLQQLRRRSATPVVTGVSAGQATSLA